MIVLDNVSKVYQGQNVDNEVLRDVNLTIPEWLAIDRGLI